MPYGFWNYDPIFEQPTLEEVHVMNSFEDETLGELTVYGCFLWRMVVISRTKRPDWFGRAVYTTYHHSREISAEKTAIHYEIA